MRFANLLLILTLTYAVSGCSGGLVALQVAGYAKTAYDYQDMIMPEARVRYSEQNAHGRLVENRIMDRLESNGVLTNACVKPNAISGHVYLVGAFASKKDALRAREIAKGTPGVTRLSCSFFITDPSKADCKDSRELARLIRAQLANSPSPLPAVRISVLASNAVLMGFVPSQEAKQHVDSLAWNTQGVRDVRSYISVRN